FTYYASSLQGSQLGVTTVHGSDSTITIVAGFLERVTEVDGTEATFEIVDDANNFVRIFHNNTLILEGTPLAGGKSNFDAASPQFIKGFFNVSAVVDQSTIDTNYFAFGDLTSIELTLVAGGTTQAPIIPFDFSVFVDIN